MEQKPISKADRKAEQKICGFHACMAVFHNRPQDIIRAYVTEGTRKAFGSMLKLKFLWVAVVRCEALSKVLKTTVAAELRLS